MSSSGQAGRGCIPTMLKSSSGYEVIGCESYEARMQPRQKVLRYLQRPSAIAHRDLAWVIETSTALSSSSLLTHSTLELPTARSFIASSTHRLDLTPPPPPLPQRPIPHPRHPLPRWRWHKNKRPIWNFLRAPSPPLKRRELSSSLSL